MPTPTDVDAYVERVDEPRRVDWVVVRSILDMTVAGRGRIC